MAWIKAFRLIVVALCIVVMLPACARQKLKLYRSPPAINKWEPGKPFVPVITSMVQRATLTMLQDDIFIFAQKPPVILFDRFYDFSTIDTLREADIRTAIFTAVKGTQLATLQNTNQASHAYRLTAELTQDGQDFSPDVTYQFVLRLYDVENELVGLWSEFVSKPQIQGEWL